MSVSENSNGAKIETAGRGEPAQIDMAVASTAVAFNRAVDIFGAGAAGAVAALINEFAALNDEPSRVDRITPTSVTRMASSHRGHIVDDTVRGRLVVASAAPAPSNTLQVRAPPEPSAVP